MTATVLTDSYLRVSPLTAVTAANGHGSASDGYGGRGASAASGLHDESSLRLGF